MYHAHIWTRGPGSGCFWFTSTSDHESGCGGLQRVRTRAQRRMCRRIRPSICVCSAAAPSASAAACYISRPPRRPPRRPPLDGSLMFLVAVGSATIRILRVTPSLLAGVRCAVCRLYFRAVLGSIAVHQAYVCLKRAVLALRQRHDDPDREAKGAGLMWICSLPCYSGVRAGPWQPAPAPLTTNGRRQSRQRSRPEPTVAGPTEEEGLGRALLLLDVGHRRVTHLPTATLTSYPQRH